MHLKKIILNPKKYPTGENYPFNLQIFQETREIVFHGPITFFAGENGSGKSTLLRAIAHCCNIHIWEGPARTRYEINPHENNLYKYIKIYWTHGQVPGSFFASEIFKNFAQNLDEWAAASPETLNYFGGKSLLTQSHGQCHMSFFKSRYKIKGLYLLDEPENALSPQKQLELLELLSRISKAGHAQFIIATHSPILLACPGANIYSFDRAPIEKIDYKKTEHYNIYKNFFENIDKYIDSIA